MTKKSQKTVPPSAEQVARVALGQHFKAIKKYRRQIVAKSSTSEAIHQFRVHILRCLVTMDTFHAYLKPRSADDMRQRFLRLRHHAGRVRDAEIIQKHVHGAYPQLTKPEQGAAKKLLKYVSKYHNNSHVKLRTHLSKESAVALSSKQIKFAPSDPVHAEKLQDLAPMVLAKVLRDVWHYYDVAVAQNSVDALHEMRRQVKRWRYTADLVTEFLPHPRSRDMAATLNKMQTLLGQINDLDGAARFIRKAKAKLIKSNDDNLELGFALLAARFSLKSEGLQKEFMTRWHQECGIEFAYKFLHLWGMKEATARWVLGRANVVRLAKSEHKNTATYARAARM